MGGGIVRVSSFKSQVPGKGENKKKGIKVENTEEGKKLEGMLDGMFAKAGETLSAHDAALKLVETGYVRYVGKGVVKITGLRGVKSDELILFPGEKYGIAFSLEADEVSAVMLDRSEDISAGMEVKRTGRVVDVPVGENLLGRVVDPLGIPLDNGPAIIAEKRYPAERGAPAIMDRLPVTVPLQTGILAIDAMIPIGRGQRELIVGDRQIGKSAIALDTIINQKGRNVICVYCSIGQQDSGTAKFIADLRKYGAMEHTIVVVSGGEGTPAMNFIAPYAATSMAEYFMEKGKDVLIIYDDLGKHARSYRELSLLLRRPPAREAFPGDIFYIHSRLLERATHLIPEKGGGSLTALPIIETESQNIAAYIPTNLVSITDGQIYLSPKLFQEGVLPPVDVGRSVSRVGGQAQLPAYRGVAGDLKIAYSQFEELEVFERFSTRLDEETRKTLDRGHRIREILKQPQFAPMPVSDQISVLLCATQGVFDAVPLDEMQQAKDRAAKAAGAQVEAKVLAGEKLGEEDKKAIIESVKRAVADTGKEARDGIA